MSEIMAIVGCSKSSFSRWRKTYRKKGIDGLKSKKASGRPPKITAIQQRKLIRLLTRGALKAGYSTDLWTTGRIAELIKRHLGISYHSDYIGPLLKSMGWSWQGKRGQRLTFDIAVYDLVHRPSDRSIGV